MSPGVVVVSIAEFDFTFKRQDGQIRMTGHMNHAKQRVFSEEALQYPGQYFRKARQSAEAEFYAMDRVRGELVLVPADRPEARQMELPFDDR